ncbi:MAG TPA: glucoamylase family protein [Thermoanaerobaculia bacterium]|nr:glucoamylase family protein [Thermoanaerobaculia bacterium]
MRIRPLALVLLLGLAAGGGWGRAGEREAAAPPPPPPLSTPYAYTAADGLLLDEIEERTFRFFWDLADRNTRLIPDRYPSPSFSSIAAVGFGLTAYPIGAERGWVTRAQAAERTLATLRFLLRAPQGPEARGVAGYRGFFYHFLDMPTGRRFETVELSTIDSSLLFAGALFSQGYFDRPDPTERAIRRAAEALYLRADWRWIQPRKPRVAMGWTPEERFHGWDWRGYNEAMILYVLALGSPTHPIDPAAWLAYTSTYTWAASSYGGGEHVPFAPLFGHQYSEVWIDVRGLGDDFLRAHGIDYFENARRATYAQWGYAIANPMQWRGYGADLWGLSACDGPIDATLPYRAGERTEERRFMTYAARGAAPSEVRDDGTICPAAAGSSLPFAPEIVLPALYAMRERYGRDLFGPYGFLDAFNPSFTYADVTLHHGRLAPGKGWFDTDYLGIDQGPLLAMIENARTGLVWKFMRKSPHVVRGLRRAGFSGGWLSALPPPRPSPVPGKHALPDRTLRTAPSAAGGR